MKIIKSLPVLLALFISSSVKADLIDFDTYTYDTSTNLSWLDLSFTENRSYNDVKKQTNGGEFADWRFATFDEVSTLIENNNGIKGHQPDYYAGNTEQAMTNLIELIGYTYGGVDNGYENNELVYSREFYFALGYIESERSELTLTRQFGYKQVVGGYYRPNVAPHHQRVKDVGHFDYASFLVRQGALDPIPLEESTPISFEQLTTGPTLNLGITNDPNSVSEPGTLYLSAIFLLGLIARRVRN